MWIKICGNTRLEDCLHAARHGADAVGFVFARGRRTVTAQQVAGIVERLPRSLEKIGVFTSRDAAEIARTAAETGLTGVQLHGVPDRSLLQEVREHFTGKVIQVVHWKVDLPPEDQAKKFSAQLEALDGWGLSDALLIDSETGGASGGTGRTFDWTAVAPLLRQVRQQLVIVAGGLRAESVAEAVRILQPGGVDVSSGVEAAPGLKDPQQVQAFIGNAREATHLGG